MTTQIVREETCCHHMGYSFWLTARVLLYAPSHRHDSTYHSLCYTSHGALAWTRNSSTGSPWRIDPTTSHHERTLLPRSYISPPPLQWRSIYLIQYHKTKPTKYIIKQHTSITITTCCVHCKFKTSLSLHLCSCSSTSWKEQSPWQLEPYRSRWCPPPASQRRHWTPV